VTARKGTVPKGAALSAEENLWFEKRALAELARLPTCEWQDMLALWNWLPLAHPATRRRILARCVELASKRDNPLPVKVAEQVSRELARAPRASVHHDLDRAKDGLRKLARHFARNPQATLSELAAAAGLDGKKTTIRQWMRRPDFKVYLNDEKCLVALERTQLAQLGSERREHIQRRWDARRSKKRAPKKRLMNGN
jgi:hypothetical protein